MAKLNKQQLYKRAYEWQKLKNNIEAKEKAMELQVKETDKLRAINKKLRAQLAEAKSSHENSGLNIADVSVAKRTVSMGELMVYYGQSKHIFSDSVEQILSDMLTER